MFNEMGEISLCRSCMKEFIKIPSNCYVNRKLVSMFYFCTNIVISENDELTKKFCHKCTLQIESTYNFIKEAQRVNQILNEFRFISKETVTATYSLDNNDKAQCIQPDVNKSSNNCANTPITHYSDSNIHISSSSEYDKSIELGHSQTLSELNLMSIKGKNFSCEDVARLPNLIYPTSQSDGPDMSDDHAEVLDETTDTNGKIKYKQRKVASLICKACKKVFKIKKSYNDHIKKHASSQTMCNRCNKGFKSLYKLQAHRYLCIKENFPVSCEQCGLKLRNQTKLKLHFIRNHSEERPYSCDVCHKRFKFKRILEQHIGTHSNVKPFLCEICGISVTQANTLKEHIKSHTPEKPYKCDLCDFQAKRRFSLTRHTRLHTGERAHQCPCCGQRFHESSELKQHIRKHTGELPYSCPLCRRKFINSTKRKEHIVRSHKIPLCDIPRMNKHGETLLNEPNVLLGQ